MYTRNNTNVCVQHPITSPNSQNMKNLYKIWKMSLTVTADRSTLSFFSKLLQLLYIRLCKPFHCMRFEVLKSASINIRVVWNVILCSRLNRYRHFGRTCCLHLLDVIGTCLHYMVSQPTSTVISVTTLLRQTIQDLKLFCEQPTATRFLHLGVLCLPLQWKWLLAGINKISCGFPWHTSYIL
jgi:hypothetical protein